METPIPVLLQATFPGVKVQSLHRKPINLDRRDTNNVLHQKPFRLTSIDATNKLREQTTSIPARWGTTCEREVLARRSAYYPFEFALRRVKAFNLAPKQQIRSPNDNSAGFLETTSEQVNPREKREDQQY